MDQVLEDLDHAPVEPAYRELLRMARTLTLEPDQFGPSDVQRALDAGATPEAVTEVMHVVAQFNTIDRVADALGFEPLDEEHNRTTARFLLKNGYR